MQQGEFERALGELSSNDKEQQLIKYHYENTIQPSGNMREDLENAKLLANRKRLVSQLNEAIRSARSSETTSQSSSSGQKPTSKQKEVVLPDRELGLIRGLGLDEKKVKEEISKESAQ